MLKHKKIGNCKKMKKLISLLIVTALLAVFPAQVYADNKINFHKTSKDMPYLNIGDKYYFAIDIFIKNNVNITPATNLEFVLSDDIVCEFAEELSVKEGSIFTSEKPSVLSWSNDGTNQKELDEPIGGNSNIETPAGYYNMSYSCYQSRDENEYSREVQETTKPAEETQPTTSSGIPYEEDELPRIGPNGEIDGETQPTTNNTQIPLDEYELLIPVEDTTQGTTSSGIPYEEDELPIMREDDEQETTSSGIPYEEDELPIMREDDEQETTSSGIPYEEDELPIMPEYPNPHAHFHGLIELKCWTTNPEVIFDPTAIRFSKAEVANIPNVSSYNQKYLLKYQIRSVSLHGDANFDGAFSISDVTEMQRQVAGLGCETRPLVLETFDSGNDGKITVVDATLFQRMLAEFASCEELFFKFEGLLPLNDRQRLELLV